MPTPDIFYNFALSCLVGSKPSPDTAEPEAGARALRERVCECYERALQRWCAGDAIRGRIANNWYSNIDALRERCNLPERERESSAIRSLVEMWAEELRRDEDCAQNIPAAEIEDEDIADLTAFLQNRKEPGPVRVPGRGLTRHIPVVGYIRRYCSSDQLEGNELLYALGTKERRMLSDFVTGIAGCTANKFVLYSSAQTGKTTELKQLCWELQQSGLYLPVSFEVRTNTRLKRSELPDFHYSGEREIIVVIDALDEVNGKKYDDLLEEIGGYAYEHPEMKIVLSCRSNYRRERQLDLFTELFLEDLSYGDAIEHINSQLGKGSGLPEYIRENNLYDFARNPFFLNVLIDAYKDDKNRVPKTRAELYELFIKRSYKTETEGKNVPLATFHSFEESVALLERVALGLSLMNVQSLSHEELLKCLKDDQGNVDECLRYDLIRKEDGRYSFEQNAFREWLVANYLRRKGITKAKQFASHPNGRIKPEWYNIIMLWESMYGNDRRDDIAAILGWLKDVSLDLVVYIDKDMLEDKTRNEVFKCLLLEYKALGIRMSSVASRDYGILLDFGKSAETVEFLAEEISESAPGTAYFADLMCLSRTLDWEWLKLESEELTEKLYLALEKKTREALVSLPASHSFSYLYMDNRFFTREEYLKRIFEVIKDARGYEAISSMMELIGRADRVDEYIDYILEKEKYVNNQHEGNVTHIVSRDVVYRTLSLLKTEEGIRKTLLHHFGNIRYTYHSEKEGYNRMIARMADKIGGFIKEGHDEWAGLLENYMVSLFEEYHFYFNHSAEFQDLIGILRKCYLGARLKERGREVFYKELNDIFTPGKDKADGGYERIQKVFLTAALWISVEDVKEDFGKFSADSITDNVMAGWYREIPFLEVSGFASELYEKIFPKPVGLVKAEERRRKSLADFADYPVFRQVVLEMASEIDDSTTPKEHWKMINELEGGYNQYAYRFVLEYVDNADRFDVAGIIKGIKDRSVYDAFFMKEIAAMLIEPQDRSRVSEDNKSRCLSCAKDTVLRLGSGREVCFWTEALRLLMQGYFEVSQETLQGLIDYGWFCISKKDPDQYFNRDYSLFEYISERIGAEILAPLVIEKFKPNVGREEYELSYAFSDYILANHIEEGYNLALSYALSGFDRSLNILDAFIKGGIKLDEIKAATGKMKVSQRLFCYSSLVRNAAAEGWVRPRLETEYKKYDGYDLKRAVQLLLSICSLDALEYICSRPEMLKADDEYRFNYGSPNAIAPLCFIIGYCEENRIKEHFLMSSIFDSLEKIAVSEEGSLKEVKYQLRKLTQKGAQYKYLNSYIISFENKYYAAYSGISDINEVIRIIDADAPEAARQEERGVYISYNWERNSAHIVEFLCEVLENKGILFKRDKEACHYTDNIKVFMNALRAGETVIVVFSRQYFMSQNCMFELSGIMEDSSYKDRILPVVMDDSIRDSLFYVELVKHWKSEKDKQVKVVTELMSVDKDMAEPEADKLKEIETIYGLLKKIKNYIDWVNAENIDSMCSNHFQPIVDKICGRRRG